MAKILCILIDGLRHEALQCAHAHCLERLMATGTHATNLLHRGPDLALPALASVFSSMPSSEHGILTNSGAQAISPHTCSLMSLARYHNLSSSLFYSKEQMAILFPQGSLQTSLFIRSGGIQNVDSQLAEQAARHIQKQTPDFCCISLQGTDIGGTHFGYLSEPYLENIEQADQAVGLLLEQLALVGLEQEYTTMILSLQSGSWAPPETLCQTQEPLFWLINGPGIAKGVTVERELSLFDLTPTLAQILGFAPHPDWQGTVISEIFAESDTDSGPKERAKPLHLFAQQKIPTAA